MALDDPTNARTTTKYLVPEVNPASDATTPAVPMAVAVVDNRSLFS